MYSKKQYRLETFQDCDGYNKPKITLCKNQSIKKIEK